MEKKISKLETPVLFIVFNRPHTTKQVFDAIRQAKPKQLFVAADGPRENVTGELEKCLEVLRITEDVDWDCEVKTLINAKNKGCGTGPSDAISWFFEHVEEGIILEDDCLPNSSFFLFCEMMLAKYKNDTTVMHVSGNNHQFGKKWGDGSYYFSNYIGAWGWATWRRAWKLYDFNIRSYDKETATHHLNKLGFPQKEINYWIEHFELVKGGARKDIWDYQWVFSCIINSGKAIVPNVNLVSNIGFGPDATHTFDTKHQVAFRPTSVLQEIVHPSLTRTQNKADRRVFKNSYTQRLTFFDYCYLAKMKLKKLLNLI